MKLGYALYSARGLYHDQASLFKVLRAVAQMGYEGVEFYGYAGAEAGSLAKELERCGLEGISTHIPPDRWQTALRQELCYAAQAGVRYVTFPWLAPESRVTPIYRRLAEGFHGLAPQCAAHGLRLQYHSHDWEFEKSGCACVMDGLLAGAPSMAYEPDTFWAYYAGVDPVACLRRYHKRIHMFHIKDYVQLGPAPVFCAIGEGGMDNERILRAAADLKKEWVIAELDGGLHTPLESAAISAVNLRRMLAQLGR